MDKKISSFQMKEYNKKIQSNINSRVTVAQSITDILLQQFNEQETCEQRWKNLFGNSMFFASRDKLGGGSYGTVYRVTLKELPYPYPLALKKTKKLELNEAKYSLYASCIAQVQANPHFLIFYAHYHCEVNNINYLLSNPTLIHWNQAMSLIRQEYVNGGGSNVSLKKIQSIYDHAYADEKTIHSYRQFKKLLEAQYKKNYGTTSVVIRSKNDSKSLNDYNIIKHFDEDYERVQANRALYHKSYEMFLMELADATFAQFIDSNPTPGAIISASFQICSAFLSFVAFFQLVQNDLLLNNIMYNQVEPDVYNVYKIRNTYYKVPLMGKLMKIIDFGLSTDVYTFHQPTKPGSIPTHWCVGGEGEGDGEFRRCSVYVRDMLEYFYNLTHENLPDSVSEWVKYAYLQAYQIQQENLNVAVDLVMHLFSNEVLSTYGLNGIIETSTHPIPTNLTFQKNVFDVVNVDKYKDKINRIINDKSLLIY